MITQLLDFSFFQNALIALLLISIASAIIGTYIVTRRLVSIAGGITHACFGGLGLGYFLGINPILMAGITAILSATAVERISASGHIREDSAIGVIWSLGMAVGVLFVFLTPGYVPELNAFLFGNILTVSYTDLAVFATFTTSLILFFTLMRRTVIVCAFDRDFAQVAGMPVRLINYIMTAFIAIGIVLTIRLVGIMLLMSMFTIPQMAAELFNRRFEGIMTGSVVISCISSVTGLIAGAFIDVPASALIVLSMVASYIFLKLVVTIYRSFDR